MRKFAISILLLWGLVLSASSQLPMDSALRYGTLPNGLTYYIRANQTPPGRAHFWLVHKVGSVMEDEHERGLAHFLEHLAFTGTKNFSESQFYNYITSNGIAFGTDVNATTGYDDTQYYITNVPTRRQSMLDSMLLIMRDLSCNLTLDSTLIDKERAIIEQERISNSGYQLHLQEHIMPVLMRGSRYAQRIPIGLAEVVSHASRSQLLEFYHRWYRPDRQALIVVGDFDAQTMERKVRRILGVTPAPLVPMPSVDMTIPDHKGTLIASHLAPQAEATMVNLYFKHNDLPESRRNSPEALKQNMIRSLVTCMLEARFKQLSRHAACPWIAVHAEDTHYLVARGKEALSIAAMVKPGRSHEALQQLSTEMRRVAVHGFTDEELNCAKKMVTSDLRHYLSGASHHETSDYVREYVDHFLSGGYIPGVEAEARMSMDVVEQTAVRDVKQYIKHRVTTDNVCILIAGPEGDDYPSDEAAATIFMHAMTSDVKPIENNYETGGDLLNRTPISGRIIKQNMDTVTHVTTLHLSNGATVMLRPGQTRNKVILFDAVAKGGLWSWPDTAATSLKVLNPIIENSKLGGYSQNQLEQMLAGNEVALSFVLGDTSNELQGGCTSTDLEVLLQILYLYFTDVTADPDALRTTLANLKAKVVAEHGKLEANLSDSTVVAMFGHQRRLRPLSEDELDVVDVAKVFDIYHACVAHPEDYTFIITGDFKIDEALPLIEKYIAGLNPDETAGHCMRDHYPIRLLTGERTMTVEGQAVAERAQINVTVSGPSRERADDELMLSIYGHILEIALNAALREGEQLTYGVNATGQLMRTEPRWTLNYRLTCSPDDVKNAIAAARRTIELVKHRGIASQLFDKVKQMLNRQNEELMTSDRHWMNVLLNRALGYDLYADVSKRLRDLTETEFSDYLNHLDADTHVTIVSK